MRATTHPMEVLFREFIVPLNLRYQDFVKAGFSIAVAYSFTSDWQAGQVVFSYDICDKLAKMLGNTAKFWWDLQCNYEFSKHEEDAEKQEETLFEISKVSDPTAAAVTYAHRSVGDGFVTFAIREVNNFIEVGVAFCSPKEKKFVKSIGRQIALSRLNNDHDSNLKLMLQADNYQEMKEAIFDEFITSVINDPNYKVPKWVSKYYSPKINKDFIDRLPLEFV